MEAVILVEDSRAITKAVSWKYLRKAAELWVVVHPGHVF